MKKLAMFALGLMLAVAASASSEKFEKKGFLTTEWCVKHDMFKDCRLETTVCGYAGCNRHWEFGDKAKESLVLYVHDEGKYYHVKLDGVEPSEVDEGVNRNEVTLIGKYDPKHNTIYVQEFKAPPPPKKSFFKGCL